MAHGAQEMQEGRRNLGEKQKKHEWGKDTWTKLPNTKSLIKAATWQLTNQL